MFSRLSPDIIDTIFTSIPDLATLISLTLVSKDIRAVFETRPSSIICAVVSNQLSPVLPQALRLVRSVNRKPKIRWRCLAQDAPKEHDVIKDPITRQEAIALARNTSVVERLEALYSIRRKDIRKKTSQLTPAESLRFQRALYRYWLFSWLFRSHCRNGIGDGEGGHRDHQQQNQGNQVTDLQEAQFFGSFPDRELVELTQLELFMRNTAEWTVAAATAGCSDPVKVNLIMYRGPAAMLQYFETCTDPLQDNTSLAHIEDVQNSIVLRFFWFRRAFAFHGAVARDKMILNDVVAEFDDCDECHRTEGVGLWCSSNCHLIKGCANRSQILNSLPGLLPGNLVIQTTLTNYLDQDIDSIWNRIKEVILSDTDDRSDGRKLCQTCILFFLGKHLLGWLIQQMALDGNLPQEFCRRGYDCQDQLNEYNHAVKFNHLREPARSSARIAKNRLVCYELQQTRIKH